jgi:AraC-like DNA-binding protein
MNKILVPISDVSTEQVPPDQRVAFWESYNASALIGLRCSTFAAQGLRARARCFDLGTVRMTDIRGNEHVIERTVPMLRACPKDSIFACLLLEGEGFFYQAGQCIRVHAGDVIAYSTDIPYLYGFTRDSRQLIVETDANRLLESSSIQRPQAPVKLDARLRSGRLLARALRTTAIDFIDHPYIETAPDVASQARSLLKALLTPLGNALDGDSSDATLWKVLRAETYIAEHLGDPSLTAMSIAHWMGISVRHLNRLFAARQSTVTQWIWSQRLARAGEDLASPRTRSVSIGEIAFRWAFANQAHFARSFKARYAVTPSEYRRRALAAGGGEPDVTERLRC